MTQGTYPERFGIPADRLGFTEEEFTTPMPEMPTQPKRGWTAFLKKSPVRIVKLAIVGLIAFGAYHYLTAPPVVSVVEVKAVTATQTLGATGMVRGDRVADLGVDVSGVISRIYVREGDSVHAGQLIMSLDKSEPQDSVASAQAALNSSIAELAKAARGPLRSEINRARAELAQAISVGDARVAGAEAKLRNVRAGNRPQEIAAAQAELQSRRELLNKAQTDLKRTQSLVSQGAVARANLDAAQTDVATARSAAISQQQRVSLLQAGPTRDEVAEARAAIAEAKATRDTSARAAREAINTLLSNPRSEDIAAARARTEQYRAELRKSVDAMAKSDLRAPFSGIVASIPVEAGQSVSPGQKLAIFHELHKPIIEVETDEGNLNDLSVGQVATVTSDANPGKSFQAVVSSLGSEVNSDRGTITIKLRPDGYVSWLRPDLTVDVNIVTKQAARSIMVPPDALMRYNGDSTVLVVRDGNAVPVRVSAGASGADGVVVSGDVEDGDLVVRNAARVKPYGQVRVNAEAEPRA